MALAGPLNDDGDGEEDEGEGGGGGHALNALDGRIVHDAAPAVALAATAVAVATLPVTTALMATVLIAAVLPQRHRPSLAPLLLTCGMAALLAGDAAASSASAPLVAMWIALCAPRAFLLLLPPEFSAPFTLADAEWGSRVGDALRGCTALGCFAYAEARARSPLLAWAIVVTPLLYAALCLDDAARRSLRAWKSA